MKAKKPILLVVLVVSLLAVALILPASAVGTSNDAPVAWVSYSSNSNDVVRDYGFQGGSSFLVKELGSGDLVGHAFGNVTMGPLAGAKWASTECTDDDWNLLFDGNEFASLTFGPATDGRGVQASFWVWVEVVRQPYDPPPGIGLPDEYPMLVVLIDGGGPPKSATSGDWEQLYIFGAAPLLGWDPDPWPDYDEIMVPSGNVVIHN
jgi:hypothetical protein